MFTKEGIINFEKTYRENIDICRMWEEKIFQKQSHDEWMSTIKKRSKVMKDIFIKNDKMFDNFLKDIQAPITEEIQEYLYQMAINLFYDNYDDALLLTTIADVLLPFYEKANDITKVLNMLNIKSFMLAEYIIRQTVDKKKFSYDLIHNKIYAYRKYYKQMDVDNRRIIMTNYYNMLCSIPTCMFHELNYTLDIYDEFIEFTSDKDIAELDKDVEALQFRYEQILKGIWDMASHIEYLDKLHLMHFYELIKKEYDKQINIKDEKNFPYNIAMAYYYTSAFINETYPEQKEINIDWQIAFEQIVEYLKDALKKLESCNIKEIDEYFLYECYYPYQEMANYLFIIYKKAKKKTNTDIMHELVLRGTAVLYNLPKAGFTWIMNMIFAEWCENAVDISENINEQENIINKIVIKAQIQTYIHSQMVSIIADVILVDIIDNRPDILMTLPQINSRKDVKNSREKLRQFVYKSALYHDIGKGKISSIINQQCRKISSKEFKLIKQHSEIGVKFFRNNQNFAHYFDIILGHHKTYDGKAGYPENFDNVNSPYRILIDLITICDCIDAATDSLGRNYAEDKDFPTVMNELVLGKSTMYNPDIVNLIVEDESLQKELTHIVTDGRTEVYYKTYEEYLA